MYFNVFYVVFPESIFQILLERALNNFNETSLFFLLSRAFPEYISIIICDTLPKKFISKFQMQIFLPLRGWISLSYFKKLKYYSLHFS